MLVEGGADLITLKRHGGWRSSAVAEGYIEDSVTRKIDVSKKLFSKASTSKSKNSKPKPENYNTLTKVEDNNSDNDYFTIDQIFDDEPNETTAPDLRTNSQNVFNSFCSSENIQVLQKKLPSNGINISNNQNCTFNISFKL